MEFVEFLVINSDRCAINFDYFNYVQIIFNLRSNKISHNIVSWLYKRSWLQIKTKVFRYSSLIKHCKTLKMLTFIRKKIMNA